jgi:hypothetical protein
MVDWVVPKRLTMLMMLRVQLRHELAVQLFPRKNITCLRTTIGPASYLVVAHAALLIVEASAKGVAVQARLYSL